jgi:transcriptional regulator with XRE-family HTH domain
MYFSMNRKMLAKKLAEKKISQQQMASDIGMRPQRLSDMLSGRLQGWKYRSRICRYLGLREEELFQD